MEEKYDVPRPKSEVLTREEIELLCHAFENPKLFTDESASNLTRLACVCAKHAITVVDPLLTQKERDVISRYAKKAAGLVDIGDFKGVFMCARAMCHMMGATDVDSLECLFTESARDETPNHDAQYEEKKELNRNAPTFRPVMVMKCYCCGKQGHMKRFCQHKHERCSYCKRVGHIADTCWRIKQRKCFCCGEYGHIKKKCPYQFKRCNKCDRVGHVEQTCRQREQNHIRTPKKHEVVKPNEIKTVKTSSPKPQVKIPSIENIVLQVVRLVVPLVQSILKNPSKLLNQNYEEWEKLVITEVSRVAQV